MVLKKLFLAHYSGDADELRQLATELRLHGILPWVDKDGGFAVADEAETEARRAIREDCFGLLLYATRKAFNRPFICHIEMYEARRMHETNPSFMLFAVPRRLSFAHLQRLSRSKLGIDLSAVHTVPLPDNADLAAGHRQVAAEVLRQVLRHAALTLNGDTLSLQYSTREVLPAQAEDVLCIDATSLLPNNVSDSGSWSRLLAALREVKTQVATVFGRPRLHVHGSKHLAAAFLFGRVFAPYEIDIRQTADQTWSTDGPLVSKDPFAAEVRAGASDNQCLIVEIASRYKNVAQGVDTFIYAEEELRNAPRLQLQPAGGPLDVDSKLCRTMARQAYREIEQAVALRGVTELHLFAAAPQAFMMMLGREFKGMPPTYLYEWDGTMYHFCCCVQGGVL